MSFRFPARWEGRDHGPNPLSEAFAARRASAKPAFDLTVSNPTAVGIAFSENWTGLIGNRALHRYDPDPKGLPSARDAIAGYYRARGCSAEQDDLLLTSGTSESYSHLFKILCEPGDEILAPCPSYPLLETLAELADVRIRTYPLLPAAVQRFTAWRPDRGALAAEITPRTRALCVVQPNNPTGSVLSPEDAAWLLELAERRDLALIVDEVFADYRHDGETTPFLASEGPLVFTLNGLSKLVGLPQLKLAWIHVAGHTGDKAQAKECLEWICDAHLSVGTAPQLACPELLRRRATFQEPIRERLRTNLAALREISASNPRLHPLWPQGGWCVPVRCAGIKDDEAFAIRLAKTEGVLVQPGYFYDFNDEETFVVSLLPEPDSFREGMARIAQALT